MSHVLVWFLLIIGLFSVSMGRRHHRGRGRDLAKEEVTWHPKHEGHCLKTWPNQDVVDVDWFEKGLLDGFRVPMASEMYYHKYAIQLSLLPLNGTSDLKEMCLKVTNNPNAVFAALTDTPLPTNWQSFSTDPAGGIFYKLATQMKHFYFKKFYLVHQGFGGATVESCASNKGKVYMKECKLNDKRGGHGASEDDDEETAKKAEDNKWMITKTDNKNYAVVVNCFPKENRKAWHVLSVNATIDKHLKKEILKHVVEVGFKKSKHVDITYDDKTCAGQEQPVAMAT